MAYGYYSTVTIDHTKVPNTDQANFPVLVAGTYASLKTVANGGYVQNSNGYDIIFTSDAGGATQLDHEIQSYDPSTGAVVFWVKVPSVSHTADTVIYMFFGDSGVSTSQENVAGVWSGHRIVYHLNETSGTTIVDKAGHVNGTKTSSTKPAPSATAKFGTGSQSFANDGLITSMDGVSPTAMTMECWVRPNIGIETVQAARNVSWRGDSGWSHILETTYSGGVAKPCAYMYAGGGFRTAAGSTTIAANTWYHMAFTATNGGNLICYVNGVSQGSIGIGTMWAGGDRWNIGSASGDGGSPWDGFLQEWRISSVARSADWLLTEYNNQNNPSSFYTVGAATPNTGSGVTGTAAVTVPAPTSSASGVVRTPVTGTSAVSVPAPTSSASGTVGGASVSGTIATSVPAPTSAASGTVGTAYTNQYTVDSTSWTQTDTFDSRSPHLPENYRGTNRENIYLLTLTPGTNVTIEFHQVAPIIDAVGIGRALYDDAVNYNDFITPQLNVGSSETINWTVPVGVTSARLSVWMASGTNPAYYDITITNGFAGPPTPGVHGTASVSIPAPTSAASGIVAPPPTVSPLPESSHPYQPDITGSVYGKSWLINKSGNGYSAIELTFDARTHLMEDCAVLHIIDDEGNEISGSPFTGYELAGRKVMVPGERATLTLIGYTPSEVTSPTYGGTDELDWGFKVTNVVSAPSKTFRGVLSGVPGSGVFNPPQRSGGEYANVVSGPFNFTRNSGTLDGRGYPHILNEVYQVFCSTKGVKQEGYETTAPTGGLIEVWRTVDTGLGWTKISNPTSTTVLEAGNAGAALPCAYYHKEYLGYHSVQQSIGRIYVFNLYDPGDTTRRAIIHVFDCAGILGVPQWVADITDGPVVDVTDTLVGPQQRHIAVIRDPAGGGDNDVLITITFNRSVGGKDQVFLATYRTATATWSTAVNVSPSGASHWDSEGLTFSPIDNGTDGYLNLFLHKNIDPTVAELYHLGVWSDGTVSTYGELLIATVYPTPKYHRTGIPSAYKAADGKNYIAYSYCYNSPGLPEPFAKMTQVAVAKAENTGELTGPLTFTKHQFFVNPGGVHKYGYTGAYQHYDTGIVAVHSRPYRNSALPQRYFATATIGKESGLYVFVTEHWPTAQVMSSAYYYVDKGDGKGFVGPKYLDYTTAATDADDRYVFFDPRLGLVARSVTSYPTPDSNLTVGVVLGTRKELPWDDPSYAPPYLADQLSLNPWHGNTFVDPAGYLTEGPSFGPELAPHIIVGGAIPITASVSGSLPPGVELKDVAGNGTVWRIQMKGSPTFDPGGTPVGGNTAGEYPVTITFTNAWGSVSRSYVYTVSQNDEAGGPHGGPLNLIGPLEWTICVNGAQQDVVIPVITPFTSGRIDIEYGAWGNPGDPSYNTWPIHFTGGTTLNSAIYIDPSRLAVGDYSAQIREADGAPGTVTTYSSPRTFTIHVVDCSVPMLPPPPPHDSKTRAQYYMLTTPSTPSALGNIFY